MKNLRFVLPVLIVSAIAACSSTPKKPAAAPAAPPPPPAAAAVSVAGNWLMTIESPQGAQDSKLIVNQTGKDITGSLDTPMGSQNFTGTFDGKEIKFGFQLNAQGMDLKIDFMGTSDGQTMDGKAVFGTFGEGTFKAKRQ
jgi:hypothetical protein